MTVRDLYEVLGVARDASLSAIKAAYRRRAKDLHPDAGGDPEDFRLLKLAHDVLSDPERRKIYDEAGDLPETPPEGHQQARLYAAVGDTLLRILPQIKSPNYEDVLALLREAVAHQLRLTADQIPAVEQSLEKLTAIASRVQVKEGENILRSLIESRQESTRRQYEALLQERELYEDVQQFLDGYQYYVQIETVLISTDGGAF